MEVVFLAVVVAVVVTSAMCSLFEAVLYSVPASYVESLDRSGRTSGNILKELRQEVDRPIAAVLTLNTIANTGGGAMAGALAATVFGNSAMGVWGFSSVFTLTVLICAEILPKTVGVVYARPLASVIARPLKGLVVLFYPVLSLTRLVTRFVGAGYRSEVASDDELLAMVGLGLQSGELNIHEARVIENVLSMEKRNAADVMTPIRSVFRFDPIVTVREAFQEQALEQFSRVPVFDAVLKRCIGVVHKVDILRAVANDRFELTVFDLMQPLQVLRRSAPLDRLLRLFLERRRHMVAIEDDFGVAEGIVTLEDVLEELIGQEIVDEFDSAPPLTRSSSFR